MKKLAGIALALTWALALAQEQKVEVRWLSHAAFRIVSPGGKVIVLGPAMSAFATTPAQYKSPEGLGKVDLLLVTHGHSDHITDAPAIAKANNIPLYGPGDLNMGDTGLFPDMKWIAEHYKPDLVMVPVGGTFTMDATDAACALRELIKPKYAIPMHYRTTPGAKTPPEQLVETLGSTSIRVVTLKPGEAVQF